MTEAKFTPGPWRYEQDFLSCRVAAPKFGGVAKVFGSNPTCVANAHLIAAAPELYEALEAVELARNSDEPHDWQRATNLSAAALAKARGEA